MNPVNLVQTVVLDYARAVNNHAVSALQTHPLHLLRRLPSNSLPNLQIVVLLVHYLLRMETAVQTTSVARVTVSLMDVVLKSKAVWNREPRRVGIMTNDNEDEV